MIPKNILVAYDGSLSSQKAFRYSLANAKQNGASLTVISVIAIPEPATVAETDAFIESGTENYMNLFKTLQAEAKSAGLDLKAETLVGHPAEQIVRKAKEMQADLIVMGHRGHSQFGEWLLGSNSKRVSSYAHCAVTIVR